ncbi:MMPL family transporter [Corynebacterium terpenotabidum]|uniref:RND superfamily drug exporter protein n=1 Tax=Corynebacterium terpenotabidum Y-11 TaxID=1200352 RepID=S4X9E8_9CORY|nr:MMPL family transporter [Corynebacterium terpenotabidum]AGP29732.1 RND superfamily drug exporter protein [Corynebacterium terpenotabidum Y-11]
MSDAPSHRSRSFWRRALSVSLILIWLGVAAVGGPKFGEISEVATNDQSSFLPGSAESTKVSDRLGDFQDSGAAPAIVVITAQTDGEQIDPAELSDLPDQLLATVDRAVGATGTTATEVSPPVLSEDGEAVQIIVLPPEGAAPADAVAALQVVLDSELPEGLQAQVTGPAGFSADLSAAFAGIDGLLLLVAVAAVLVVLVLVYRSPFLPLIVLLSSMVALCAAVLVNVSLARAGVVMINGQIQGILFILVIGAATDYGLLYTARYREELGRHDNTWSATVAAIRGTWQPVLASAATVIAGLLCLLLSDLASNAGLGPVAAVGIAAAFFTSLTFLPAVLALCGRRVFWPRIPRPAGAQEDSPAAARDGIWDRVAALVARAPRRIAVGVTLALLAGCAGLFTLDADGVPTSDYVIGQSDARDGQAALDRHFPAGSGAPAYLLVPEDSADEARARVDALDGVQSVSDGGGGRQGAGSLVVDGDVMLEVTLTDSPYSDAAEDTVREIRDRVGDLGAMVGGTTATELDTRETSIADREVIIPVVLLVITVMLVLLLRSVVAPLVLLVTTVLSFGTALGVGAVLFAAFGASGSDPSVPLYAFVFLVALAIDYNIFLMTRVREESMIHGTAVGMSRGLVSTGGVITSAGVVLAATFAALLVIPIQFLVQLAVIISLGVLIDTFLVRSFLVPALTHLLGDRIWWPGGPGGPRRADAPLSKEGSC